MPAGLFMFCSCRLLLPRLACDSRCAQSRRLVSKYRQVVGVFSKINATLALHSPCAVPAHAYTSTSKDVGSRYTCRDPSCQSETDPLIRIWQDRPQIETHDKLLVSQIGATAAMPPVSRENHVSFTCLDNFTSALLGAYCDPRRRRAL